MFTSYSGGLCRAEKTRADHGFGPFYRPDSEILILGSFPSVKSREQEFYYAHPQNRFWRVIAGVYGDVAPETLDDKKQLLERRRIALWDSVQSCNIIGSGDSSISEVIPADIPRLLGSVPSIKKIILNGRAAEKYFLRYNGGVSLPYTALPSTSPANAAFSLERLIAEWKQAL